MRFFLVLVLGASSFLLGFPEPANSKLAPRSIFCGFSENTYPPQRDIELSDPGSSGVQFVHQTSRGDELFLTLSTMPNLRMSDRTDLKILILSSTSGGFFESQAQGIEPIKHHGVNTTIPLPRKDGGLYFVKVECSY